jgi:tetratricopeptide (TPR) repeat protein
MITSTSIDYGSKYIEQGNYKAASLFFKIWTICDHDKKNSWYNLARVCSMDRQYDEALFALERSVKNGLHNKELIKNDTAFKYLLNQRRFIRLIQKIN